jgi:hypothetical protein
MEITVYDMLNLKIFNDPQELLDAIACGKYSRNIIIAATDDLFHKGIIQNTSLYDIDLSGVYGEKEDKGIFTTILFNKKDWNEKYLYMLYAASPLMKCKSLYLHFDEVCRYIAKKKGRKIFGQTILVSLAYATLCLSPVIITSIIRRILAKKTSAE